MPETLTRIAYTPGEPAGIGPDLGVMLAQGSLPCELIAVCDPDLLSRRAKALGLDIKIIEFDPENAIQEKSPGLIQVFPIPLRTPETPGQTDPENSRYVINTINLATQLCIDGTVDAMMTGPVHKGVINDAGIPFSGHTEHIADITGGHPVMMLATPGLRVALATTHIPVHRISRAITQNRLDSVLSILHGDLRSRFNIGNPRILVCGLNPHAGEGGHLGHEEIEVISPVLERFRKRGIQVIGPLPADTLFTPQHLKNADAVLAMYHDQGLPVLKFVGFGQAVNITLGLPIIRTSVDHGTALDLAASGNISTGSASHALEVAMEMCRAGSTGSPDKQRTTTVCS